MIVSTNSLCRRSNSIYVSCIQIKDTVSSFWKGQKLPDIITKKDICKLGDGDFFSDWL